MLDHDVLQWLAQAHAVGGNEGGGDFNRAAEAAAALERAFACSTLLAVYGTLAPGKANHHQLADCHGTWRQGTVHGHLGVRDYPVFTYDAKGPAVPMQVLRSTRLPRCWPALDAFEGPGYRRRLVPVWWSGRIHTVANLYEAAAGLPPHGAG